MHGAKIQPRTFSIFIFYKGFKSGCLPTTKTFKNTFLLNAQVICICLVNKQDGLNLFLFLLNFELRQ
jgi:hypothetical protein